MFVHGQLNKIVDSPFIYAPPIIVDGFGLFFGINSSLAKTEK